MTRLKDGFKTLIAFDENPNVKFEEVEVTPPAITGGGPNNTTTMRNTALRTMAPKHLYTVGESQLTVSWDPLVYNDIIAMINVNQEITITFPDGETVVFWGWVDEFTPGSNKEGEMPTATVKIVASNMDDNQEEIALVAAGPTP